MNLLLKLNDRGCFQTRGLDLTASETKWWHDDRLLYRIALLYLSGNFRIDTPKEH